MKWITQPTRAHPSRHASTAADAGGRVSVKAGSNQQQRRADRLNAAKQAREAKRAAVLASRRAPSGPRAVAVLPLSRDVDAREAWTALLAACGVDAVGKEDAFSPRVVSPPEARRTRLLLLPPPGEETREDPFLAVDVGRAAQVVLLLLDAEGTIDAAGMEALRVLRALGTPPLLAVVRSGADPHDMKARSAAKKRASGALSRLISAEPRVLAGDGPTDWAQVARQLGDQTPSLPLWRQGRPQVLVEEARAEGEALVLRGYVANVGLSVRQALHVPGAGDFAMARLDEAPEEIGADAMESAGARTLAVADPGERASLQRENVPDPLAGEQTWPTEEELMEAESERRERARLKKRRLPAGTSEYQAAWIVDEDDDDDEDEDEDADSDADGAPRAVDMDADDLDSLLNGATGTEIDMGASDEEDEAEERRRMLERRRLERDDQDFPDEVDTPEDVAARERFAKYRGLKSFRTSPWDPMESLPREYARVFAFDNFIR